LPSSPAPRAASKAIAIALAEAGADVAVNYRERQGEADATVTSVKDMGRRSAAFGADASDAMAVSAMIARVEPALGPVDILVNHAGVALRHSIDEITETDFDHTIATNLKSAFLCTQAVWKGMRARGWGRIVNVSSGAARGAGVFGVHYNASKAGLEGLTRGYAARLVRHGITVNAVAPSLIDTEMIASQRDEIVAKVPLGRLGTVEEIAAAVVTVASNPYMNGQTVHVNGGYLFN